MLKLAIKTLLFKWRDHLTYGLIAAISGFLMSYTECLLYQSLTVEPVFFKFSIYYMIFVVLIFFLAGLFLSLRPLI